MALPIAPTPVLNEEDSIRFMKLVEEGLKNPTGPVPTPKLEEARLLVLEYMRVTHGKGQSNYPTPGRNRKGPNHQNHETLVGRGHAS